MRDYAAFLKKAKIDALELKIRGFEAEEQAAERAFIKAKGLKVESIASVDSGDDFDKLFDEFFALPEVITVEKNNRRLQEKRDRRGRVNRNGACDSSGKNRRGLAARSSLGEVPRRVDENTPRVCC